MAESRAQYELGGVANIRPEAIGQPGQRTFRMLIESGAASVCLWLEKEQLQQLGVYLEEATESEENAPDGDILEAQWSGGATSLDFKIGRMSLAHSPATNSFLLITHDLEDGEDSEAKVSFWLAYSQAKELAKEALRVCAAGRPSAVCVAGPSTLRATIAPAPTVTPVTWSSKALWASKASRDSG